MAYTALYREWRPKTFNEVVGQKQVTVTLKNQIQNNRIAHAYLLCGTRGTGKTSTAKILAKAVNCLNLKDGEPCNECEMCKKINAGIAIDVTEMDAASHNKIEHIRKLIEDVQYPPQEARYKVYIIDEVHMLSMGAVNAFLKTLEEPPKNVIFILATTDPQKLPITILSRCQRFDFKRIKKQIIQDILRKIVTKQGVLADDKSLSLIARMSDGAARDALSILDQAIAMGEGKLEYDKIIDMLGIVTNENLLKLTDNIIEKDVEKSMLTVDEVVLSGKETNLFIKEMTVHLRNLLMIKVSDNPEEILDMSTENMELVKNQAMKLRTEEIMRFINILQEAQEQSKWSKQGRIYLELAIIKMCKIEYDTSKEIILARINKLETMLKEGVTLEPKGNQTEKPSIKKAKHVEKPTIETTIEEEYNKDSKITLDDVKKNWKDILEIIKGRRLMVVFAYLSPGKPIKCEKGIVYIEFGKKYSFSKQNLQKQQYNKVVEEIFSHELKERVRIKYIVEEEKEKINKSQEEILKETFGEDKVEVIDE